MPVTRAFRLTGVCSVATNAALFVQLPGWNPGRCLSIGHDECSNPSQPVVTSTRARTVQLRLTSVAAHVHTTAARDLAFSRSYSSMIRPTSNGETPNTFSPPSCAH